MWNLQTSLFISTQVLIGMQYDNVQDNSRVSQSILIH